MLNNLAKNVQNFVKKILEIDGVIVKFLVLKISLPRWRCW